MENTVVSVLGTVDEIEDDDETGFIIHAGSDARTQVYLGNTFPGETYSSLNIQVGDSVFIDSVRVSRFFEDFQLEVKTAAQVQEQ